MATLHLAVPHGGITRSSPVTVSVQASPNTALTLTLRLSHTTYQWVGRGKHRKHVAHTTVLYHASMHGRTSHKGRFSGVLRIGSVPKTALKAVLGATVKTPRGSVEHHLTVKVYPPRAARPSAHAKHPKK